jgi:hypothetical protein
VLGCTAPNTAIAIQVYEYNDFYLFSRLKLKRSRGAVAHRGAAAFSTNWPGVVATLLRFFVRLNRCVTHKIGVQQLVSLA